MGTASKALSLLNYFSRSTPQIGLSDIARLSGMNKATVHRLMSELASHGFVEQVGAGREYRLGPAFLRLAALREKAVPMRELVMAELKTLSEVTGETAHMSLLNGDVLSNLAYSYAHLHGTMVMMEDAEVLELHSTGSGLAVLAFSPTSFVDTVLNKPLVARTSETITDPKAIRAQLPQIRRVGMAQSIGGFEQDVHSHAAPIFDATSHCIGAMAVAAPVSRMTDTLRTTIQTELAHAARRTTRVLGGFPPDTFPLPDLAAPAAESELT
ncbi:transcriptional regulator, IclR family [Aliiroseovarius halocynthiae]|uniref:IclR family transcriptional regulator n=1 Tax=Aliiroseovarius halocynthiae TaxID=985055 RepID=A0A545SSI5_9RHOB|nr:IclR family transcriptional regulator [Aliiroseovarius halocynthiae]TQV67929.1 IclR family transcriptional regulator [Aliiroseovarius halocynthiae]SMR73031.1 transcriptional regulator, IclR family [Aliiroseovarius halocynthiae]